MHIYIYVLYSHRSSKHHEMVLSSTSPRFFAGLSWLNSNNYIDSIDGGSPMIHGGNHQPISGGGNLLLFQQYYPIYIPHFFA